MKLDQVRGALADRPVLLDPAARALMALGAERNQPPAEKQQVASEGCRTGSLRLGGQGFGLLELSGEQGLPRGGATSVSHGDEKHHRLQVRAATRADALASKARLANGAAPWREGFGH
ncbi:MAG: hypothetical protein DMG38_28525 [Acidobacteria bacterium]|nr:MAG: hypothetical protein DMG38_28525 [Acidobacteriota bacterium]